MSLAKKSQRWQLFRREEGFKKKKKKDAHFSSACLVLRTKTVSAATTPIKGRKKKEAHLRQLRTLCCCFCPFLFLLFLFFVCV
jgi:hypothetical protein